MTIFHHVMRLARFLVWLALVLACAATASAQATSLYESSRALMDDIPAGLNITCDQCSAIAEAMIQASQNTTARDELLADINATCPKLFPDRPILAMLCIRLGDVIVLRLVPLIDAVLEYFAWDARAVCSNIIPVCTNPCCASLMGPEKLRLSLPRTSNGSMFVTWTTLQNTPTHVVQWGPPGAPAGQLPHASNGWWRTYTVGGWIGIVHTAVMAGLQANTTYAYRVGDAFGGWSPLWTFTTLPAAAGTSLRPLRIIQIGDMSYDNSSDETVAAIAAEVDAGTVDMILHVGDVSYADANMPHWDVYFQKIQKISARVPYMTSPGNHELWYNFTAYKTHFWMPSSGVGDGRMYYSFDYGGVHFAQMNTETVINMPYIDTHQRDWLVDDLASRANVSFTIVTGHRPFYCTTTSPVFEPNCAFFGPLLRGLAEPIFVKNGVDLVISCHMHGYERTWPVSYGHPAAQNYTNPAAPVYVVNGAAGNREGNQDPPGNQPWSAGTHSGAVGYGRMHVDAGLLCYQFVAAATRQVVDSFCIAKT
eukprot:m.253667 g.253667  ORF g.253667 m.253667 type:complete len:536 (+) comp18485_c0_seq1:382-1989(+)